MLKLVHLSGRHPVDCLDHPSLMYLHSYLGTVLQAMLDVSTNCDTSDAGVAFEAVSCDGLFLVRLCKTSVKGSY